MNVRFYLFFCELIVFILLISCIVPEAATMFWSNGVAVSDLATTEKRVNFQANLLKVSPYMHSMIIKYVLLFNLIYIWVYLYLNLLPACI